MIRFVVAGGLLVAMMGAESPSCQRRGDVHSDRPPAERQAPAGSRTAVIRVTEATGPHDIQVRAHKLGEGLGDWSREHAAVAGYSQTLTYAPGTRIEIVIRVSGHAGDMFACEITDGPGNRARNRGAGEAYCSLTTRQ